MGEFSDKVYEVVKRIPAGYVSTYGDVARAIGHSRSARYVGFALRANPSPTIQQQDENAARASTDAIPCHRVVFADGQICDNFAFGGPDVQRALLHAEGVAFVDDMHVDMKQCRWEFATDMQGRPADIDWAKEMAD